MCSRKEKKRKRTDEEPPPDRTPTVGTDPDAAAKAFVEHYYSTFDADLAELAELYQDESILTFEGEKITGSQNIVAKFTSLPFQQYQHQISTIDCQTSGPAGGMLVFVSGSLQLEGGQQALKFSQMLHLIPTPEGSFYVLNDIFRFQKQVLLIRIR